MTNEELQPYIQAFKDFTQSNKSLVVQLNPTEDGSETALINAGDLSKFKAMTEDKNEPAFRPVVIEWLKNHKVDHIIAQVLTGEEFDGDMLFSICGMHVPIPQDPPELSDELGELMGARPDDGTGGATDWMYYEFE